jgi:hypothetical protein
MAPPKKNVAFASAQPTNTGEELVGSLVAFRPIEVKVFETKHGESEATVCQIAVISDDGTSKDLGEHPVFWQVVRQQLERATAEVPWIVGRLQKSGQAYKLEDLTEAETPTVRTGLLAIAG